MDLEALKKRLANLEEDLGKAQAQVSRAQQAALRLEGAVLLAREIVAQAEQAEWAARQEAGK